MLVYNVDSIPNKAEQISEVVDMVFQYKTYLEQTLLTVLSLDKQDLILEFTWLKIHNPEVD